MTAVVWQPTPDDEADKLRRFRRSKAQILLLAKLCPRCNNTGYFGDMQPRKGGRMHEAWCGCGKFKAQVTV